MQVMFIFIFLTIFYFTYVAGVEKNEFISQMRGYAVVRSHAFKEGWDGEIETAIMQR